MEREYSDEKRVHMLKKLYNITPVKAIKAVLAIADPAKLLQGFVNLFLAKPFGGRSLMQKMAANGSEVKRTKDQLSQAKRAVMDHLRILGATNIHHVLSQTHNYVATTPLPDPEEEDYQRRPDGTMDVCYERLLPQQSVINILRGDAELNAQSIEFTDADIVAIRNLIVLEMRLKEKN